MWDMKIYIYNLTNIVLLYFASNTYTLFMHLMTCHAKYGM